MEIPAALVRGLSPADREAVARWWAGLDDASRRELADPARDGHDGADEVEEVDEVDEGDEPDPSRRAALQTPTSRLDRVEAGLLGLLVGDALGVPYEFHDAAGLPKRDALEFDPPAWFHRSHAGVPPGTWSDDGAQALCLLASLLERDALDLDDFSARLVRWRERGYLAVDGVVFDIGAQTDGAIEKLSMGTSPLRSGPASEHDNGNGALMRVLPLALWHRGDDRALLRDAMRSSLPTHGHLRSQLCCGLYCLWTRRMLEGHADRDAWALATEVATALTRELAGAAAELQAIDPRAPPRGRGGGYVVDCLHSARLSLAAGGFEHAVKAAVALGDDTDTTAAVTGGVAGVREGVDAIPRRWRLELRGRELLDPLLDRLLDHAEG